LSYMRLVTVTPFPPVLSLGSSLLLHPSLRLAVTSLREDAPHYKQSAWFLNKG
jgi:hypothetical protein